MTFCSVPECGNGEVFTGLIAEVGTLIAIERDAVGARLWVGADGVIADAREGDSIAVEGVCLTVSEISADGFEAEVMNQTLELTTIGEIEVGSAVNLEPALRAGDRLGGHIVQGHIDGVGTIASVEPDGFARRVRVEIPEPLRRYTVEHGSIGLNGVSLTVSALTETGLEVSLIPETLERTTFAAVGAGAPVNVEVDLIARYAERLLQGFNGGHDSR